MRIPTRTLIVSLFAAALVLPGCGRQPSAPIAAATSVPQEAIARIGDVTVRASVVQTSVLGPAVASQYGITRDDKTVMLLVAVRTGAEAQETSLPAQITATVTDLRGQKQPIAMRELRVAGTASGAEQALLDYVGTVEVELPDTLRFDLTIVREGGASSTMQFTREFYPR